MKMTKQIIRSRTFLIAILIGLLGAGSVWFPLLGIPIAALTILGAWMQGYENEESAKHIQIQFLVQEKLQLLASETLYEQYPWELRGNKERLAEIDSQLAKLLGS